METVVVFIAFPSAAISVLTKSYKMSSLSLLSVSEWCKMLQEAALKVL